MDFHVPERVAALLATVRAFVDEELIPLELDFIKGPFSRVEAALGEKRQAVKRMELFSPHVAREHGGAGLSLVEFAFLSEELGRTPAGHYVFNCQAPDAGNMELLSHHGTPEQRRRFLQPLVSGDIRSCFAMTEPEYPGSNPVWMGATATREHGEYVINGHKWFTTAADGASFAIVMAITDAEAASPHRRATQILVPLDTPGYRLVRNISVMGEAGDGASSHAEVVFENCRVPAENRLGPEGAGFLLAQQRLGPGRIHHCMRWIGICNRAFELMCRHAATRELAPGEPLGHRQIVQSWIAESKAELESARLLVLYTAWKIDAAGASEARDEISLIKFHVAGVLQRILDRALQVHGALGMTDDTPLAYWFRHERGARIYDGADEVHKAAVAKRILAVNSR